MKEVVSRITITRDADWVWKVVVEKVLINEGNFFGAVPSIAYPARTNQELNAIVEAHTGCVTEG